MSQVIIENPIINSPFDEPTRHFRFSDEGKASRIAFTRPSRSPRASPMGTNSPR